ncbi:MAG TPA: helix-turn-helix domain-containing protein [Rudaea sp.]
MSRPRSAKTIPTQLCDRLRFARQSAKFTQETLAYRLGVTPSAVAQWERPRGTRPSIRHLDGIALATGVSIEWLATGRGSSKRSGSTAASDDAPAAILSAFAHTVEEELMLERFRLLSPAAQDALCNVLADIVPKPRRHKAR